MRWADVEPDACEDVAPVRCEDVALPPCDGDPPLPPPPTQAASGRMDNANAMLRRGAGPRSPVQQSRATTDLEGCSRRATFGHASSGPFM